MDKEGKKRLLKLASELERCSKGRVLHVPGDGRVGFDMASVVEPSMDDGYCYGKDRGCGTAACAMGFAGLHPWFQQRGLKWNTERDGFTVGGRAGFDFDDAAEKFFGIDLSDATNIFTMAVRRGRCIDETPKQVAKRIRAFVAEHT